MKIYRWLVAVLTFLFITPVFAAEPDLIAANLSEEYADSWEQYVPDVNGWEDELHGFVIPAKVPDGLRVPDYDIYLEHPDEELPDGVNLIFNIETQDIWYYTGVQEFPYSVPHDKWESLSTDQLLAVVLENQTLRDSWVWENDQVADILKDFMFENPGLEILFQREDFFSKSLEGYKSPTESNDICGIECLWLVDQIENGEYSVVKRAQIEQAVSLCGVPYSASISRYHVYDKYVAAESNFEYPFRQDETSDTGLSPLLDIYLYDPATITLPNNATVPALYDRRPDKNSYDRDQDDKNIAKGHNAILSSPGTVKYNCHSYAWFRPYTTIDTPHG